MIAFLVFLTLASVHADPTTVDIGGGVLMPRVNLGTCCGSDPRVGLSSWFSGGGVGIDSAWDCEWRSACGAEGVVPTAGNRATLGLTFFRHFSLPTPQHAPSLLTSTGLFFCCWLNLPSPFSDGNQAALAAGLKASGKPRTEYFITSKVPGGDHMPPAPGIPGACACVPFPDAVCAHHLASLSSAPLNTTPGTSGSALFLSLSNCAAEHEWNVVRATPLAS
jgi:hypothetical protein